MSATEAVIANSWADLLKSLKLHHFLFVIIGAATIWVVAHLFAEPGSAVKVLWGLVEYTKPSITEGTRVSDGSTTIYRAPPTAIESSDRSEDRRDVESSQGQAVLSIHTTTKEGAEKATQELREQNRLRSLSPLYTDISVSKSPQGTFFFADAIRLTSDPEISANRGTFWIEIHHLVQGKFVVVCYTTQSDAERIRLSDRGDEVVTVFMEPWRNHTTIVEIPLDRIKEGDTRRITTTDGEVIYGMDMVVDSTVH